MLKVLNIALITSHPDIRKGSPCIAGTGIRVTDIAMATLFHHRRPHEIALDYLRVVVLLKTVLRRLKQTKLNEQHIDLIQHLLNLLMNERIQSAEIMTLHKQFRTTGIETMMRVDKQYPTLVKLYEQDNNI